MQDHRVRIAWRSRIREDPEYRHKLVRSVWLCFAFFCLGLISALTGPAFLDLQIITNTNLQQASAFLSADAAGIFVGSLLAGPVYDLASKSLLLIFTLLLLGLTLAVKPFCAHFWLMVVVCFVNSSFRGSLATVGNAELMEKWGSGEGHSSMQAMHFTYALGAVLAAPLMEPFLAPSTTTLNHTLNGNSSDVLQLHHNTTMSTAISSISTISSLQDVTSWTPGLLADSPLPETRIYIGYLITAGLVFLSSVPFAVEYVQKIRKGSHKHSRKPTSSNSAGNGQEKTDDGSNVNDSLSCVDNSLLENNENDMSVTEEKEQEKSDDISRGRTSHYRRPNLPLPFYLAALLWTCLFYVFNVAVEASFPYYLANYVVIYLHWTKTQGAMVTLVFWMCFAFSRMCGIMLAHALRPVQILMGCISILITATLAFFLASLWYLDWVAWVSSGAVGFAVAALFPTGVTWLDDELMPVTGRVMSALLLSSGVGGFTNPIILGHLMEEKGPIWMVYLLFGEAVLCLVVFVLLHLCSRFYLQRRFAPGSALKTAEFAVAADVTSEESHRQPKSSQPFLNEEISTV